MSIRLAELAAAKASSRTAAVFGTAGGALGCVSPLEEQAFRRLAALSKKLCLSLYHTAGLHPAAFRKERVAPNSHVRPAAPANMVDGELLVRYLGLDVSAQFALAKAVRAPPSVYPPRVLNTCEPNATGRQLEGANLACLYQP
jgi:cleavage and polyadenylation specificity factor subunit 1